LPELRSGSKSHRKGPEKSPDSKWNIPMILKSSYLKNEKNSKNNYSYETLITVLAD
jgi:hypothetical protein